MAVSGGAVVRGEVVAGRSVRGFQAFRVINGAALGRTVRAGRAVPIVVLGQNDVFSRGGQYRVVEAPTIPMVNLTGVRVKGGPAIPVYPVDANGNYDATF